MTDVLARVNAMMRGAGSTPMSAAMSAPETSSPGARRKPIVGGNWKCNPATTAELPELVANFGPCADLLDKCDVYVCPSNLHVGMIYKDFAPGIMVAPQNCNFEGCGAYTGEMAVDQMADMGLKVRNTRHACTHAPVHTRASKHHIASPRVTACRRTKIVLPDWPLGASW